MESSKREPRFEVKWVSILKAVLFAVIFVGGLWYVSCSQEPSKVASDTAQAVVKKLTYVKDARTKLCFAVVATRGETEVSQNGFTITYVPCTPEVESIAER